MLENPEATGPYPSARRGCPVRSAFARSSPKGVVFLKLVVQDGPPCDGFSGRMRGSLCGIVSKRRFVFVLKQELRTEDQVFLSKSWKPISLKNGVPSTPVRFCSLT